MKYYNILSNFQIQVSMDLKGKLISKNTHIIYHLYLLNQNVIGHIVLKLLFNASLSQFPKDVLYFFVLMCVCRCYKNTGTMENIVCIEGAAYRHSSRYTHKQI